jgi:hypothetical protein
MRLIVKRNTSANMFYLLKHLSLLIFVIFKLKCNSLIFNEIMVLNVSYMCLHVFSLRRESPVLNDGYVFACVLSQPDAWGSRHG